MRYCKVEKRKVYSCDCPQCNGQDRLEHQGMHYCRVRDTYVYGCDHSECYE
jgi:Zn ribbon nucleic-acid-binding protein